MALMSAAGNSAEAVSRKVPEVAEYYSDLGFMDDKFTNTWDNPKNNPSCPIHVEDYYSDLGNIAED